MQLPRSPVWDFIAHLMVSGIFLQASASDEGARLLWNLCMMNVSWRTKNPSSLVLRKCRALPMWFFFFLNHLLQQSIQMVPQGGVSVHSTFATCLHLCILVRAEPSFSPVTKGISSLPGFRLLILGETIPKANTNLGFLVVLIQKRDSCSHWVKGYLTVLCWRTRACTKPLLFFVICSLHSVSQEP